MGSVVQVQYLVGCTRILQAAHAHGVELILVIIIAEHVVAIEAVGQDIIYEEGKGKDFLKTGREIFRLQPGQLSLFMSHFAVSLVPPSPQ